MAPAIKLFRARGQHSWHPPMDLRLVRMDPVNMTDSSLPVSLADGESVKTTDGDKIMTNYSAGGGIDWLRECDIPACVPIR
jgi:hypothetical protein